jgi:uncharacterized protein YqgC (DUF456 family)
LGIWGSVIGMIIGILFFPPWGILIGAFAGAILGEILMGKKAPSALRAGWGVFIGTIVGTGLKMAVSIVMLFYYIKEMF